MKYIGAHVSIAEGVFNAPLNAKAIGAKAFALFTKNQMRWYASHPYSEEDIDKFKANLKISGISSSHILAHSSYLINLGQPNEEKRNKSIDALVEEVKQCMQLGIGLINFHPGSHLREITELDCLDRVASSINTVLSLTEGVVLVIENTAGQGSNLGYKFEHLAHLINKTKDKKRIGVCVDTCHLFAAGYDIRTKEKYEEVWEQFNEIVGFQYLKGMHLNDCKNGLGSKLDRHGSLGEGNLGLRPFKMLMKDARFDDIPLILETPNPDIWKDEIKLLHSFLL